MSRPPAAIMENGQPMPRVEADQTSRLAHYGGFYDNEAASLLR